MITIAASDLSTVVKAKVLVANRTYQRAEDLAKRIGGKPIRFDQTSSAMENVDAVFTCTASTDYLINAIDLEAIMKKRSGKPLILIDASVPRNVEPVASMIRGVKLYNIDDLVPYVRVDESLRKQMSSAEEMIEHEVKSFYARIRLNNANEVLRELRKMAEDIREKELTRALRKMGQLSEHEKEILDLLTKRIVNKLLYEPTVRPLSRRVETLPFISTEEEIPNQPTTRRTSGKDWKLFLNHISDGIRSTGGRTQ